jgi:enoyl-[acyl-carrier protein] reductase II
MWDTSFTRDYGLKVPFVGAGMAMISAPPLVAAVSEAGGLGQLGTGPVPPPLLRDMIRSVRALTARPFAVNLIIETTGFGPATSDAQISICAEERVPVVVFHWNLPPPDWLATLHAAGCRVWPTIGSLEEAQAVGTLDVDAIMVQGREAGGHTRAKQGLLTLLPHVRAIVKTRPLIAAGGIGDGRSAAAAFAAGAAAVCIGTRLVASDESMAHAEYKARLIAARPEDTILTELFGPEWPGAPMRILMNRPLLRALMPQQDQGPIPASIGETEVFGRPYVLPSWSSLPPTINTRGDFDEMCCLAGEGVGFVNKVQPAHQIVHEIMAGAAEALKESALLLKSRQRSLLQ